MTLPTTARLSTGASSADILSLQRSGVQYVASREGKKKEYGTYDPVIVNETGDGYEVVYQGLSRRDRGDGYTREVVVTKRQVYSSDGTLLRETTIDYDNGRQTRQSVRDYTTGEVSKKDYAARREEKVAQEQALFKAGMRSNTITQLSPGERRAAYNKLYPQGPSGYYSAEVGGKRFVGPETYVRTKVQQAQGAAAQRAYNEFSAANQGMKIRDLFSSANNEYRLTFDTGETGFKTLLVNQSVYNRVQAGGFGGNEPPRDFSASPLTTSIIENVSGFSRPRVRQDDINGRKRAVISNISPAQSQLLTGSPGSSQVQILEPPRALAAPVRSKDYSTHLSRYEERVARLEQNEKNYFNSPVFQGIQGFSNFITFGGGSTQRSFAGQTSQNIVSGFIGAPFALGGTAYYGGGKVAAFGEAATMPETRRDIFPALGRPFRKIEQGPFNFLPGGTRITPEGASTLGTALIAGLPSGIKAGLKAKNAPPSTGELFAATKKSGNLKSNQPVITVKGKVFEQYEAYGYDPNYPLRPRGTSTITYFEKTPFRQVLLGRVAVKTTLTTKRSGYVTMRQQAVNLDGVGVGDLFVKTQRPGAARATVRVYKNGDLLRTAKAKPILAGKSTVELLGETKIQRAQPEQISQDTVRQSISGKLDLGVTMNDYAGYLEARSSAKALSIIPRSKVSVRRSAVDLRSGDTVLELTSKPKTPRGRLSVADTNRVARNERILTRQDFMDDSLNNGLRRVGDIGWVEGLNNRIEARAMPTSAGEIRATVTGSLEKVSPPSRAARFRNWLDMKYGPGKVQQPSTRPYDYTSFKNAGATMVNQASPKAPPLPTSGPSAQSYPLVLPPEQVNTIAINRLEPSRAWSLDVAQPILGPGTNNRFPVPFSPITLKSSTESKTTNQGLITTNRVASFLTNRATPISRTAAITREKTISRVSPIMRTSPITRTSSLSKLTPLSKVQQISRVENVQKITPVSKVSTVSKLTQITKVTPMNKLNGATITRAASIRTIPPPPILPPLFGGRKGKNKGNNTFGISQPKGYQPSAYAIVGRIFGKPSKRGLLTGLGVRPQRRKRGGR